MFPTIKNAPGNSVGSFKHATINNHLLMSLTGSYEMKYTNDCRSN